MRLIDADALIDDIERSTFSRTIKEFFEDFVEDAPTVEAKPVVHGEWKNYYKENIVICKNCSYEHYLGTYHQYATNFCPNCGADMRGGKNERNTD